MKDIDKKYFSDLINSHHEENIDLIDNYIKRVNDKIHENNKAQLLLINKRIDEVNDSSRTAIQKTVSTSISVEIKRQNEAEQNRINDIFVKMGIDIEKPFESQALIQFIRAAKKRSDTMKDVAFKKALMVLMNVIFFIFMLGAGTYFIDKKIEIALAPREQEHGQSTKKEVAPGEV